MQEKIAVVGISLELPSGRWSEEDLDHNSFFQFLLDKGESYTKIPTDRFNIDAWYGNNAGQINVDQGSFLKNIDLFDNVEFGVSSKDAKMMAPSTRKLLEHSFLALLDSGIDYRSKNVGCFTAGVSYDFMHITEADEFEAEGSFAGSPAMIANRISYHLDLLGPSVPLDTACSSSGTALHLAATSLLNGDCEAAIVGGCQLNHSFIDWFNYSQGGLLAPDGKCKPFDASADGFSRGEGVVTIVIKPLWSAVRDGDHIYGTILGTAVNATGSAAPPNAPVAESQRNAMNIAFSRAGVSTRQVDYVECHATGTAKGDPTEANWVGEHLGREDKLLIGSVKGNIGHTEIAAFLASLSKVLSMFHHRVIPPNVNLRVPNPAIRWSGYDLAVPLEPTPLPSRGEKTLIAMASSGIGGANAHVVLESHSQDLPAKDLTSRQFFLLTAGGLSPRSAETVANSLLEISATMDRCALSMLEARSARQTRQMTWRTFTIVDTGIESDSLHEFPPPALCPRLKPPTIFVFSGQGPQYRHMGCELFRSFPRFKDTIVECDAVYQDRTGKSLLNDFNLFNSETSLPEFDSWPVELTLPALTIFQIALFDLLRDFGIIPDIILGHSAGETAVLYASGAGSKSMAVELSIARGQALSSISTLGGGMAALSCSAKEADLLLRSVNSSDDAGTYPVEVACYNSLSAVAISGPRDQIVRVLELAKTKGIQGRTINTRVPMHSSMIESCRVRYCKLVDDIFDRFPGPHLPSITTCSTLTGEMFDGPYDSAYFWKNSLAPVRFTQSLNTVMRTAPNGVFLEISPHPILGQYIGDMIFNPARVFPCATRPRKGQPTLEVKTFLQSLGHLIVLGSNSATFKSSHHHITMPKYPFIKKSFPLYPGAAAYKKQTSSRNGPLNHPYLKINKKTHPSLAQHVVREEAIMPAAGFIEMAFEFGATALIDVNLRSILTLSSENPISVDVRLDGCRWSVVSLLPIIGLGTGRRSESHEKIHSEGYLSFEPFGEALPPLDISGIRSRCQPHNPSLFYPAMSYALQYGPLYQRVTEIHCGLDEALLYIKGHTDDLHDTEQGYILQPAILDACIHIAQFRPFTGNFDPNIYYLPSKVSRVVLHQQPQTNYFPDAIFVHCNIFQWEPESITFNIYISDVQGKMLCSLEEFQVMRHRLHHIPEVTQRFDVSLLPSLTSTNAPSSSLSLDCKSSHLHRSILHDSADASPPTEGESQCLAVHCGEHGEYRVAAEHTKRLFDMESALVFSYNAGAEMELQWFLSGIEPSQPEDIWITATEGRAGDEAQGLTRSLRKEFPAWTIRLVVFPQTFDSATRKKFIEGISYDAEAEEEFVISSVGDLLVPTMVKIESKDSPSSSISDSATEGFVRIQVLTHSTFAHAFSFIGLVDDTPDAGVGSGVRRRSVRVAGIAPLPVRDFVYVHPHSVYEVSDLLPNNAEIDSLTFGSVVASLAPSLAIFEHPERLRGLRVLLTHSNTAVGIIVGQIYRACGVDLVEVQGSIGAIGLSRLGHQSFDLIVSGFTDQTMQQIIHLLAKAQTGATFFWDDMKTGILAVVKERPWVIHDAIHASMTGCQLYLLPGTSPKLPTNNLLAKKSPANLLFRDNKSYILVGGAGSLGPQIALWMYLRGARHLILTSRSGEAALHRVSNIWSLRIVRYLRSRKDLRFTIVTLDATDRESLRDFLSTVSPPLDGCFVLTTKNADGVFVNLSPQDFATVRKATCDVTDSLEHVLNIEELDFLVVMSSVSAVFGNGGQANYGLGKSVADGLTRRYRNAMSFVCPPIAGTTLVSELQRSKGSSIVWEVSAEEMIISLEDALLQLQNGNKFWYYIPDLDWAKLIRFLGPTELCNHLLPSQLPVDDPTDAVLSKDVQVLEIVRRHIDIETDDLFDDVPLVSYGLDSLSASRLSFDLGRELDMQVTQIRLLANMTIHGLIKMTNHSIQNPEGVELSKVFRNAMADMRRLLAQYSGFPSRPSTKGGLEAQLPLSTVLITGTTGSLGCHLLHQLIASTAVVNVIALNRISPTASLLRRQELALENEGLPREDACSPKVLLLDYDPSAPNLGLSAAIREKLLGSVTCILHNAWKSDFTAGVSSFEDLLMGTRGLIFLALESKLPTTPLFTFVSSIGVSRFSPSLSAAVEQHIDFEHLESLETVQLSDMSGYLQAKLVAEQMVLRAQTDSALPTNIIRIGQLSGGPTGAWDTSHWFPALVKSALFVKCLPDGHDMVSWLPTHIAAAVIIDMSTQPNGVLHAVHPRPVRWGHLLQPLADIMSVRLVPYAEWFSRLSVVVDANILLQFGDNPAVKLIDFFRQGVLISDSDTSRSPTDCMGLLPKVSMERGVLTSKVLRDPELQQLNETDARRWVAYWRKTGFL